MRLTTDKPTKEMGMYELAHNSCYIDKDGNARYRDFDIDVDARVLARELLKKYADGDDAFTDDYNFDDEIMELLQYGTRTIEGLIALFYRNLWAMADLRETLKQYEDFGTVEELKALKDKPKCDECAGCTAWKCDCANIRETVITEFAEKLKNKLVLKYGNASAAQQYVAMQVTDWCAEIAKELKQ